MLTYAARMWAELFTPDFPHLLPSSSFPGSIAHRKLLECSVNDRSG